MELSQSVDQEITDIEDNDFDAVVLLLTDAVTKIAELWENSTDEGRNGLVHNLFEEIIYDLDKQRNVDFQLKAWAEQFLVLRGQLYEDKDRM